MNLRTRVVAVLCIAFAGIVPLHAVSNAQSSGSELTEAVTAEASGDEAYIVLQTVEAFPAGGGEAVFEPGTANEEFFTYASAQADAYRLVGLTRENPLAHPAGVHVAFLSSDSPEPSPGSTGSPPAPESGSEETTEDEVSSPTDVAVDAPPEVCEPVAGRTCGEIAGLIVGDPPSAGEVCADLDTTACQEARDAVEGLVTGDPCDPANTGQSCVEYIGGIIQQVQESVLSAVGDPVDDLCDPQGTGQTCDEWIPKTLGPVVGDVEGTVRELTQPDPCRLVFPQSPHVGTVAGKGGLIVGDAAAYCPGFGPITLIVCMESGAIPAAAIPHNCLPWDGATRVDGYSASACLPGMWFTYAEVWFLGAPVDRDHSDGALITSEQCATGDTTPPLPGPV